MSSVSGIVRPQISVFVVEYRIYIEIINGFIIGKSLDPFVQGIEICVVAVINIFVGFFFGDMDIRVCVDYRIGLQILYFINKRPVFFHGLLYIVTALVYACYDIDFSVFLPYQKVGYIRFNAAYFRGLFFDIINNNQSLTLNIKYNLINSKGFDYIKNYKNSKLDKNKFMVFSAIEKLKYFPISVININSVINIFFEN